MDYGSYIYKHQVSIWWAKTSVNYTLNPVMPGPQTFLTAYLCIFRVCAKDKYLGWNFKRIRRTDKLKGWQTYWKQFRLLKIFANDTLPSYARATDISVCLPMHIQGLCQRQNLKEKIIRSRLTDEQTNWEPKHKKKKKNFRTISDKKLGRNLKSKWTDELIKWQILKCFASWHEKK